MPPATRAWPAILLRTLLVPALLGMAAGCGPSATQDRTDAHQGTSAPIIPPDTAKPPPVAPLPRLDEDAREALRARELVAIGQDRFVGAYSAKARTRAINAALELWWTSLPPPTDEDGANEVEITAENSPEWWAYAGPANEADLVWYEGNPDTDYEVDSLLSVKVFDHFGDRELVKRLEALGILPARIENLERLDPKRDILLIPTGALSGLWLPSRVRPMLEAFVGAGGRLVVFCQRTGDLFSMLPRGDEIEAVGWHDAQGRSFKAARLVQEHPGLSGVPGLLGSAVSLGVDGYFRWLPEGAEVLLEWTGSDYPVLASYSFGAGRVFVTSMFEDGAWDRGMSSPAGTSILRNLVEWLRKPVDLPAFLSTSTGALEVSRPVRLRNLTEWPATIVTYHWVAPNGAVVYEEQCPIDLLPGEESMETATWLMPQPAARGIWFVDYSLRDARWPVQIRGLDADSRFVVTASRTRAVSLALSASSALPTDSSWNEIAPEASPPQ